MRYSILYIIFSIFIYYWPALAQSVDASPIDQFYGGESIPFLILNDAYGNNRGPFYRVSGQLAYNSGNLQMKNLSFRLFDQADYLVRSDDPRSPSGFIGHNGLSRITFSLQTNAYLSPDGAKSV